MHSNTCLIVSDSPQTSRQCICSLLPNSDWDDGASLSNPYTLSTKYYTALLHFQHSDIHSICQISPYVLVIVLNTPNQIQFASNWLHSLAKSRPEAVFLVNTSSTTLPDNFKSLLQEYFVEIITSTSHPDLEFSDQDQSSFTESLEVIQWETDSLSQEKESFEDDVFSTLMNDVSSFKGKANELSFEEKKKFADDLLSKLSTILDE
ncbi:hypothetical protein P9112_006634 [Eukaryota sp. TZLM1-RC]